MRKRIKVVQSILEVLDLKNVIAMNVRVEDIFEEFDFVASRAVTAFPRFVGLVQKNISQNQQNSLLNGIIYLKGGNFPEKIKDFEQIVKISEITKFFNEPFFDNKKVVYLIVRKMLVM